MSELLLIVGNSGAGKDWIAANRFANFTVVKLNQPFKDKLEVDSGLSPGDCNDKSKRAQIITVGPFKGETIQDAMISAYHQSLSGVLYGRQFRTLNILKTLEKLDALSKNRTPVVITDVRKREELEFLLKFAPLIYYNIRMLWVRSSKEIAYSSDESLHENIAYFQRTVKPIEICWNEY